MERPRSASATPDGPPASTNSSSRSRKAPVMRCENGASPCRPRRALEASVVQHIIDGDALPYAPDKLARKPTCVVDGFLGVDLRVGPIIDAAPFACPPKPTSPPPAHPQLGRALGRET